MTPDLKADLLRALDAADGGRDTPWLTEEAADALRARLQAATITEPGTADLNNPMVREPLERFLDDARQHAPRRYADEAQRLLRILKPEPGQRPRSTVDIKALEDPESSRRAVDAALHVLDLRAICTSDEYLVRLAREALKRLRDPEPQAPQPDPCVVEGFEFKTWRGPMDSGFLRVAGKCSIYGKEPEGTPAMLLSRGDAAALIPALQAFVAEGER